MPPRRQSWPVRQPLRKQIRASALRSLPAFFPKQAPAFFPRLAPAFFPRPAPASFPRPAPASFPKLAPAEGGFVLCLRESYRVHNEGPTGEFALRCCIEEPGVRSIQLCDPLPLYHTRRPTRSQINLKPKLPILRRPTLILATPIIPGRRSAAGSRQHSAI